MKHNPRPQPNGFLVCCECGLRIVERFAWHDGNHWTRLVHQRRTRMHGPAY